MFGIDVTKERSTMMHETKDALDTIYFFFFVNKKRRNTLIRGREIHCNYVDTMCTYMLLRMYFFGYKSYQKCNEKILCNHVHDKTIL